MEVLAISPSQRSGVRRFVRGLAAAALIVAPWCVEAREGRDAAVDSLPVVQLDKLPRQAQETHALVLSGGPFPYEKDGTVFGNRERLLPRQSRGYYREYTVRTPGVRHRGARRIVCGGVPPTAPAACYYTEDHYASFKRIAR